MRAAHAQRLACGSMANLAVRCPRTATTGRFRVIGAERRTAAVLGRRFRPSGRRRPFLHSASVSGPSHTLWRRPKPDPELRPLALFHGRGRSAFKVWSAVLRSSRWWRKRERVHGTSPHGSTAGGPGCVHGLRPPTSRRQIPAPRPRVGLTRFRGNAFRSLIAT